MMKKLVLQLLLSACFVFADSSTVNIFIDSPIYRYDKSTSSIGCPVAWPVPTNPDTANYKWTNMSEKMKLYWNLGENIWDYDSGIVSEPSEFITSFGANAVEEGNHLRFNLGCYKSLPYQYSNNWRANIGPLDSTERETARSICGFTSDPDSIDRPSYLPERFSAYGIPEMIRVADTLGGMPVFVYMGTCDTTFEISDSFWYHITDTTEDGSIIEYDTLARRKSLYYDAYCFAQYLFGDPATDPTGFARLRVIDGCTTAVASNKVMLGNDVPNKYAVYYCDDSLELKKGHMLYDYIADSTRDTVNIWPKFPITDTLFPGKDSLFYFDDSTSGKETLRKYRNQYAYRYRARLDTVASAFKAVQPDIKVSAYTTGSYPNCSSKHTLGLTMAALGAKNIDYIGFNQAINGGHTDGMGGNYNEWDRDSANLNYNDTSEDFMSELLNPDSIYANRFLLNESLGDLTLLNYLHHYFQERLPTAVDSAQVIFGDGSITLDKSVDITEYERFYGFRWNDDIDELRFNSLTTISYGIKFLEVMRNWNRLRAEYQLGGIYSYNFAMQRRGMYWGLSSLQRAKYQDAGGLTRWDGGNYYPLTDWADSAITMGVYPVVFAHMIYSNVGMSSIDYSINSGVYSVQEKDIIAGTDTFPFFHHNTSFHTLIDTYTVCTADPYIAEDGHISVVLVNRDTTKEPPESHTIVCSLKTIYEGFEIDSVVVSMPVIDTALWREACDTIYGDSMFLPLGFAHNGFTYTDAAGLYHRFTPVSYNSFYPIDDPASAPHFKTDSTTYISIELEPLMFAKVDVYPKRDSVEITLHPGWNHLSVPLYTGNISLYELFHERRCIYMPCTLSAFIDYNDMPNEPGKSYLIAHLGSTDTTFYISGVPCYRYITDVYESPTGAWFGGNMIGSVFDTARFTDNYLPGDITVYNEWVWYWNPDSQRIQITYGILPTYGCWMEAKYENDFVFPDSLHWTTYKGRRVTSDYVSSVRYLPNFPDTANDSTTLGVPPDSLHFYFDIDWSDDEITVWDKATYDTLENVMVIFVVGDSADIQYTGAEGTQDFGLATTDLDIGNNDSTWVILFKQGYCEAMIHPYGTISNGDTMWGDVYINGDITVGSDDTLVILPGTNIYAAYRSDMMQTWMADRIDIVNQGHIIAVGDSLAPITFTVDVPADSTPAPNDWKGIVHHYSGSGEYEHCRFEYMRYFQGHQPGGDVTFKNCTFAKPLYNAISYGTSRPSYIDPPKLIFEDCQFDTIGSWTAVILYGARDSSRMTHCVFDSAGAYALEFKDSCIIDVEACTLNSCYGALMVYDYSSATITDCDLHTFGSWYGWNINDAGTLTVENTLFSKTSSGTGPRTWSNAVTTFRNCSVTDFTDNGVSCNSATVDMGTDKDLGHNCVWSDHSSANRLYFATKTADEFSVFGNWIDTLIFGGPSASYIDTGSFFPPDSCDTSIAKIVIEPENKSSILPEEFELGPARPNPFNSTVTFDYNVPMECDIEIAIYDILGNKIRILFDGTRGTGLHSEVWDGKDDKGRTVASGTYLYRLKADDYEETRKMTFLK